MFGLVKRFQTLQAGSNALIDQLVIGPDIINRDLDGGGADKILDII